MPSPVAPSPVDGSVALRALIYARFSSDLQSPASIEDQLRLCRERAAAEGWDVVQTFADYAITGAISGRSGYQAMLATVRSGTIRVVLTEALDRLSRDQEDIAGLYKRLKFLGVRLVTLAEGEITPLHIGFKGTMNAIALDDLADKTRRGLRGRVEVGKSAGGRAYGYDVVRQFDAQGNPIRGDRRINEAEAAIVRRTFALFAAGHSPIAIAKALNAEHVPGPEGAWRDTTIRGHAIRGTGILRNELYIGRLVWNRMRFMKDPDTGKRVSQMNPPELWIIEDVPALRIVDQALWDQVQARLADIREASGANEPDRPRYWEARRAKHLLTDKTFCGCCGGVFTNIGRDYLACSAARRQGTCANKAGIRRQHLETLILDALRTQMMDPALVADFVDGFTAEWNRMAAERNGARAQQERELAQVERKLNGLIDALADGFRAPGLQQQLNDLEGRRAALSAALETPASPAPSLHPNLAEVYRERVADLQEALRRDPNGPEALEVVRGLIERVDLHPAQNGRGLEVEISGAIVSMLRLGMTDAGNPARSSRGRVPSVDPALFASSVKVVAGAGFEPAAFRL
ncbi:serine recombinase [Rhodopila globiformis]|uniref:Serine recombinase n=2 Tax=Rhodopila globiformis TaxID=1071 RepID=A0A2S6NE84_RHOGL|nr:serine recombinase [Rhodopila globiformis]